MIGLWVGTEKPNNICRQKVGAKNGRCLFADTAAPDSPVYWLMTGYGTVENRRLIAPSVAGLMQTLLAIYDFEQKWQAEGRAVYDEEGCCAAAELSAALHDLLYRELPPECAAGFGKAFWG